jgi:hypothetical protein
MATAEANLTTTPRRKRLSPQRQRNLIAQTIERLLDLLDAIEPDPEAEPSLGWPTDWEGFAQVQADTHHLKGYGNGDDRKGSGHLGLTDDHEPEELGFTNLDSAQYYTPEFRAHMKREFGEL